MCIRDRFLKPWDIQTLVRKYSDYIRYPIKMMMDTTKVKEGTADSEHPEYETVQEDRTLNSMVPIWQKKKSEVTDEEYNSFYKEKFYDFEDPVAVIHADVEGAVTYKALLYVPAKAPYDFYTKDFKKGLQLYSSGVLTADHWAKEGLIRTEYGSVRTENILIILGSSGQVTYVNDIFYQLFSTNYNNVINYPLPDVVPELGYVIDSIYGKGIIPSPQVVTFSAIGATEYHVTCTYADGHSADKGFVITAQRMLSVAKSHVSAESGAKYTFDSLVGVSDNFCALKQFAERVAATNCTVLIRGESGTGKELFAHSIHNASNRWDKPFVSINCAAIPRDLIGSELFGYVGGAFTGASRTGAKGKFEQADGGTLFLDEIAEMPLDMQSVLLRVLEEGEITRIGGSKSIPVNVRLIAATNQNLEDYIRSGKFRLDLFYRLNIISLNTIPLREHKADIDALADSFISKFSKRHNKPCDGISAEARSILHAYDWPENTRELRNVIERGIITMSGRFIETHDLPPELMRNGTVRSMRAQEDTYSDALISDQESSRKKAVAQLMREYDGNKAKVARSLGIARSTLYRILKGQE